MIGGNSRNKKQEAMNTSLEFWGSAYENIKVNQSIEKSNMSTI